MSILILLPFAHPFLADRSESPPRKREKRSSLWDTKDDVRHDAPYAPFPPSSPHMCLCQLRMRSVFLPLFSPNWAAMTHSILCSFELRTSIPATLCVAGEKPRNPEMAFLAGRTTGKNRTDSPSPGLSSAFPPSSNPTTPNKDVHGSYSFGTSPSSLLPHTCHCFIECLIAIRLPPVQWLKLRCEGVQDCSLLCPPRGPW